MFRLISLITTIKYGLVTVLLTLYPQFVSQGWLAWLSEWWGVITAGHLALQILPLTILCLLYDYHKGNWEWSEVKLDAWSSGILAFAVWIVVPVFTFWVWGTGMIHWQWKIWLYSAVAAFVEVQIAIVQWHMQKNAPPAP